MVPTHDPRATQQLLLIIYRAKSNVQLNILSFELNHYSAIKMASQVSSPPTPLQNNLAPTSV